MGLLKGYLGPIHSARGGYLKLIHNAKGGYIGLLKGLDKAYMEGYLGFHLWAYLGYGIPKSYLKVT